jgi:hypothetical protein
MKIKLSKRWDVYGSILLILTPIGLIINDYAHPEWASDWLHDPRRYLPVIMWVMLVTFAVLGLWLWDEIRRDKCNERYKYLLGIIGKMNRTGRCREGEEAWRLYWKLIRARGRAKKDMLERRFLDTYRV